MENSNLDFEQRLKNQEEALAALKDVPNLLAKLLEKDKPEGTEDKPAGRKYEKGQWSLGLSDEEEEDHESVNQADMLLKDDLVENDDSENHEVHDLLEDVEKGSDLGPDLSKAVADSFLKTVMRPLSKETRAKLRDNIKTPSNCKEFAPPKVNNEIWKIIPSNAKLSDLKQQQIQQGLGTGLTALSIITNQIISRKADIPKEIVSSVVKLAIDAGNILGDHVQQISSGRRFDLKRYLNPEYSSICSAQIPQSEFLFGNELTESLKNSKATSNLLRNTAARGGQRSHPYNRVNNSSVRFPQASGSLNYRRPFQHQRGNGQYRPQFNFRKNGNFAPMGKLNQPFQHQQRN